MKVYSASLALDSYSKYQNKAPYFVSTSQLSVFVLLLVATLKTDGYTVENTSRRDREHDGDHFCRSVRMAVLTQRFRPQRFSLGIFFDKG